MKNSIQYLTFALLLLSGCTEKGLFLKDTNPDAINSQLEDTPRIDTSCKGNIMTITDKWVLGEVFAKVVCGADVDCKAASKQFTALAEKYNLLYNQECILPGTCKLEFPELISAPAVACTLKLDPTVEWAEPNYYMEVVPK